MEVFSTRRLEALTDGVFAIAMTLLVLDLKVDSLGHATSSGELWHSIASHEGSIVAFVVSFLLLGSMWAVHMRQFEFIKRADRHLTMINTLRLLAVVFIPLTTSIAGDYSDEVLGRVLFPLNFFILAAVSSWQWRYAVRDDRHFYDTLTKTDIAYLARRNTAILITAGLVTLLAIAVGEWAFLLFLLAPYFGRAQRATARQSRK